MSSILTTRLPGNAQRAPIGPEVLRTRSRFAGMLSAKNIIRNVKIGTRLALAFAVVLALASVLGLFAIKELAAVKQSSNDIAQKWMVGARLIAQMNVASSNFRIAEAQHILSTEEDEKLKYVGEMSRISALMDHDKNEYVKLLTSAEEKNFWDQFVRERGRYLDEHEKLIRLSVAGLTEDAKLLLRYNSQQKYERAALALNRLVAFNEAGGQGASTRSDVIYASARGWIVSALLCVIVLGASFALAITVSITLPIKAAVKIAEMVAIGDLTSHITIDAQDETGQLLQALKTMNESLVKIVSDVRTGADNIASTSMEMAGGNHDLSKRTEQQATTLQKTAATMANLNVTVKRNGVDAAKADQLAQNASQVALNGGKVVAQVVQTMDAISQSSKRIVDIISVIDGIAFQTNILALNAAVEAARAGEQGRGFAVVASEVRNLAQRSAGAAKEIKVLIGDSVDKVAVGTMLVAQAGTTMDEIVASIKSVTRIMETIVLASRSQNAGIDQVNQELGAMDETTQRNAALVEEAAAAAESLHGQAEHLAQGVSLFRLSAHRGG